MTTTEAIRDALTQLPMHTTARLDAEVLLAYVLSVNRSWLHAHPDNELTEKQILHFMDLVARRARFEPIAYLIGTKEFYGREFTVTPDVLIPRPETEDLLELTCEIREKRQDVLDLGCGSGCIGITLKLERPDWSVTLADISQKALRIARRNAETLKADVELIESDLMSWFIVRPRSFDCIVANLPYVNRAWETSPGTKYEPSIALFADENGLALIYKLIVQSKDTLKPNGHLVLEADPEQHPAIIHFAEKHSLSHLATRVYSLSFEKKS